MEAIKIESNKNNSLWYATNGVTITNPYYQALDGEQ